MGGGGGNTTATTSIQDVPREFKPAFTSLFNSAFGAARQAAGQGNWAQPYVSPQYSQMAANQQTPQQQWAQMQSMANMPAPQGYYPGVQGAPGSTQQGSFGGPFSSAYSALGLGGGNSMPLLSGPPILGQAYPGAFTAPTSPLELESLAAREQIGRSLMGAGQPLMDLGQYTAMGGFLQPGSNPYLAGAINYALTPAVQQFMGSTLPAFESQALQAGGFKGSSARDMAVGQMAGQFGRDLLGTAATVGYQDYANERQLQQQAGQLIDQAARLQQLGPEILSQTGLGQREIQQRLLDEQLLRFQEMQQAPFRPLGPLASIIQGTNIGQNFSGVTQGPQPSALGSGIAGALGGTAGGLGLANLLGYGGTGQTIAGGLGALAGGLAGGLA